MFDLEALIDTAVTEAEIASGMSPLVVMKRAESNGRSAKKVTVVASSVAADRRTPASPWTPEEDAYLDESLGHLSIKEIADALGRTPTAVKIRWTRQGMAAPSKQEGESSATHVARRLGMCGKKVIRLIDEGIMPGRVIPGGRNIHVVKDDDLRRWLIQPDNWIYLWVDRIKDRKLKRLAMLAQERWPDEWWSPGQVADYHGLKGTGAINQAIHRGSLPAVRWYNWHIRKSDAVAHPFTTGKGNNDVQNNWSPTGDAFILLARAVGLAMTLIGYMRGENEKRAQARLVYLQKKGQIRLVIKRFGLDVAYDANRQYLWTDWRVYADRLPGLVRAIERFKDGRPMSRVDASCICGVLWSWAQWHAETEEQAVYAETLKFARSNRSRANLEQVYETLLGWGIDPLGDDETTVPHIAE